MATYTVTATNWATAVENKIHDNEVARQYGFGGGLVPGVTLYAYMTRPVLETWGPEWLRQGTADVRFVAPVYDGDSVTAVVDGDRLELRNSAGTVCATGSAGVEPSAAALPPVEQAVPPATRPAADERSLDPGTDLGSVVHRFHAEKAVEYLDLIGDDLALYRGRGAVAHPGWLLLDANEALVANVVLGPWIHVGSRVRNLRPVTDGQTVVTRSRVTANYERKGHRLVELDVVTFADEEPALVVQHTAIWQVRRVSS